MPVFDPQSADRISAVVQRVERNGEHDLARIPTWVQNQQLRWFELLTDLSAGGTANAAEAAWGAASASNQGDYTVITQNVYQVRDTTGRVQASNGEWVLCRPLGNGLNATVWEVISSRDSLFAFWLTQDCWPGDAYATGLILGSDDTNAVQLYPPLGVMELGIGRAGDTNDANARGTYGWCQFAPDRGCWEVVWGDFTLTVEGVAYDAIAAGSSGLVTVWWPSLTTGEPVSSGQTVTAHNASAIGVAAGDHLTLYFDRTSHTWYVIPHGGGGATLQFGVAQADWESNGGDNRVSVKLCERNGTNATGSAFYVYLPRDGKQDPIAFAADGNSPATVLSFLRDASNTAVAVGTYCDGSWVGEVRLFLNDIAQLPPWWEVYDAGWGGRFPMFADGNGRADEAANSTGGYRWHGEGSDSNESINENNHNDHPHHKHQCGSVAGAGFVPYGSTTGGAIQLVQEWASVAEGSPRFTGNDLDANTGNSTDWSHSLTDNRPRYVSLPLVRRKK